MRKQNGVAVAKTPAKSKARSNREAKVRTDFWRTPTPDDFVFFDFESYYDEECSVKTLGPDAYTRHPSFCAYWVTVVDGSKPDTILYRGDPSEFDWSLINGRTWVAHNMQFEWTIVEWARENAEWKNLKKSHPRAFHCTSALAAFLKCPRDLAGALQSLYGHTHSKSVRQKMSGKKFEDLEGAEREEFIQYADDDSLWGTRIYREHASKMTEFECRLMVETVRSGMRGVLIDVKYVKQCIKKMHQVLVSAEQRLPWIERGERPSSTKALAEECRKNGIEPPASTAEDSPECAEWEEIHGSKFDWVAAMRDWRKANRLLKVFETLLRRTNTETGVFQYTKKYFGAHTGRWSGDGGFNMENMPREATKIGDFEVHLRRCIIPRHWRIGAVDSSQIEPRVLDWLAGDEESMERCRNGEHPYEVFARQSGKWDGEPKTLKKEDERLYRWSKACVIGLGYQCGHIKFRFVAKAMAGLDIDGRESKMTVNLYRNKKGKVVALWNSLHKELALSVKEGTYEVELPSGRSLTYHNLISRLGQIFGTGVKGKPPRGLYGGIITENVDQAISRDVIGWQWLQMVDEGIDVLFTTHDEIVTDLRDDEQFKRQVEIMNSCPPWLEGCPIACEGKAVEAYE